MSRVPTNSLKAAACKAAFLSTVSRGEMYQTNCLGVSIPKKVYISNVLISKYTNFGHEGRNRCIGPRAQNRESVLSGQKTNGLTHHECRLAVWSPVFSRCFSGGASRVVLLGWCHRGVPFPPYETHRSKPPTKIGMYINPVHQQVAKSLVRPIDIGRNKLNIGTS